MDKNNNRICIVIIFTALLAVILSYSYTYNMKSSEITVIDNSSDDINDDYNGEYYNFDGFFGTLYGEYAK